MPMYRIRMTPVKSVQSNARPVVKSPVKLSTMAFMSKGVKSCRSCR